MTKGTILGNVTVTKTQENIIYQEFNSFPAGDFKVVRNRQESMTKTNTNNKKDPQKKHQHWAVSKKITGGVKYVLTVPI